jgi:hypothetical protein
MTTQTSYHIPYPVERALENVADQLGVRPVRVHTVAFPLYVAELSATVMAREPFDLLDRYVGLAIGECGFRSAAEISAYLGVTEHIVGRVLQFLSQIGHVTLGDGALALTALGLRAVRDDTRYVPKEDRLKLYFEGVGCTPLPSGYYSRNVKVMSPAEALAQRRFKLLGHTAEFTASAVGVLARRRDRAAYNLPDEHENLTLRAADRAFLPCYLIRVRSAGNRSVLYTAANSSASDAYLEEITQDWPPLAEAIQTEDSAKAERWRAELSAWLDERGLSLTQLTWSGHDVPRLTLPASHFPLGDAPVNERAEFPVRRVGSYITPENFVVQLWCPDERTRREAALQRALEYADATRRDTADVTPFLTQISTRLELQWPLTMSDLRTHAHRTGRGALAIERKGIENG